MIELAAFIALVVLLSVSAVAVRSMGRLSRTNETLVRELKFVRADILEVHEIVTSRLSQLLAATITAGRAEGRQIERDAQEAKAND